MSDPVPFATDAWIKRLGEECNKSQAYYEAARNWEGDLYLVLEPGGSRGEPTYMYIDLYHGQCRQAFVPNDPAALNPEFIITGSLNAWKELAERKIDPMKALLTRKFSLKGNMAKAMRNARAATELVNLATHFKTQFPSD